MNPIDVAIILFAGIYGLSWLIKLFAVPMYEEDYKKALDNLSRDPNNVQLRRKALELGRKYYASTHSNDKITIYDESAISNDLLACTQGNTVTNNKGNSNDELIFCRHCGKKVIRGNHCSECGKLL